MFYEFLSALFVYFRPFFFFFLPSSSSDIQKIVQDTNDTDLNGLALSFFPFFFFFFLT